MKLFQFTLGNRRSDKAHFALFSRGFTCPHALARHTYYLDQTSLRINRRLFFAYYTQPVGAHLPSPVDGTILYIWQTSNITSASWKLITKERNS